MVTLVVREAPVRLRTAVVIASRLIEFRQPEAYFAQSEFRTKRSQSILNFGGWPRCIDQRRQLSTWSLLCLVTMPETCQVGEGRVVEHLCSGSAPALLRPFGQRPPSTSRCSFLLDVSVFSSTWRANKSCYATWSAVFAYDERQLPGLVC